MMARYQLPPRNLMHDSMAQARISGYSWHEINSYVNDRKQAMSQFYSPGEIDQFLGNGSGAELSDRLQAMMTRNMASNG
jgi:hypothetical protein